MDEKTTKLATPELIPYRKYDSWGFCNSRGEVLIQPIYQQVNLFDGDLARVEMSVDGGWINKNGDVIVPNKR